MRFWFKFNMSSLFNELELVGLQVMSSMLEIHIGCVFSNIVLLCLLINKLSFGLPDFVLSAKDLFFYICLCEVFIFLNPPLLLCCPP